VVEEKSVRVCNYAKSIVREVGVIAHSCGIDEPRQLQRKHARIVRKWFINFDGAIISDKQPGVKMREVLENQQ
jgi:hypothetical protein